MVNRRISEFTDTGKITGKTVFAIVNDTGTTPVNLRANADVVRDYIFTDAGDSGTVVVWDTGGNAVAGPAVPGGANAGGRLVDTGSAQTLTGKTISAKDNTLSFVADTGSTQTLQGKTLAQGSISDTGVHLAAWFAGGTNADTGTFLRGDGAWGAPSSSLPAVYTAIKTDTGGAGTIDTWKTVTGLSTSVTVASGESVKIDVTLSVSLSAASVEGGWQVLRDSTVVASGDTGVAGTRTVAFSGLGYTAAPALIPVSGTLIDTTPGAGTYSYTVQVRINSGTGTINRSVTDSDNEDFFRGASTLTCTLVSVQ